ncbi:hypothetical protein PPTG_24045 [Phytophthora nicotianae INRA-310]|uniref:Uncharacterized protein n=1 Tax=Phytophthora nicotianae (strain INRA-310) TaxID=761204 RepID=W2PLX2_PHYN3|nr:hypothetical protein PPTG_24045 [Phytophthora nicotianae INRA-310]ETN01626.1 hypothetical protein PPTG_24045 [Phytophthora nicotianae INRA-310]
MPTYAAMKKPLKCDIVLSFTPNPPGRCNCSYGSRNMH